MKRREGGIGYSRAHGRICARCGHPVAKCRCHQNPRAAGAEGPVRVQREVKGRRGKAVTTISGLPLSGEALGALASELKRRCATGGSVKQGVIEIQGDHRDLLVAELEDRGYAVKRSGG